MSENKLPHFGVNITRLPNLGAVIKLAAEPADIPPLVSHMGLESMEKFTAKLKFRHWARDGVQVEGDLVALVETQCPVTLKPVSQKIEAQFHAKFAPATSKLAKPRLNEEGEMILDFESDDIPDIFEGDKLDAWEIAIEYLLLEIDPYARASETEIDSIIVSSDASEKEDEAKASPFSVLKSLKK